MSEATVAVVGATGCVGRHMCAAFDREGREVLAIARRPGPVVAPHRFVPMDVTAAAPREIAGLFNRHGVDAIVNATGGRLDTDAANEAYNARLVEHLLDATALMPRLPRPPRVVQLGSVHEYGPLPRGRSVSETAEPRPVTSYGRAKLAGTRAVLEATRQGRASGVVLRVVNVCGPHATAASFLSGIVRRLREAGPDGTIELDVDDSERDYVDVRDLADAVVRAVREPVAGQVINIGRGEAVSVRDLVSLLVAVAGRSPQTIKERNGGTDGAGRGDFIRADIGLARRLLDWRPRVSLHDSLRDMWAAAATDALPVRCPLESP